MNVFVRQERGTRHQRSVVDEIVFPRLIVARFVVFEPEMRDLIAERQKEVIAAVVSRPKECPRFRNELSKLFDNFGRRVKGLVSVRGNVQIMSRLGSRAEIKLTKMAACQDRRIDERR